MIISILLLTNFNYYVLQYVLQIHVNTVILPGYFRYYE